jgi:hypothetical protein
MTSPHHPDEAARSCRVVLRDPLEASIRTPGTHGGWLASGSRPASSPMVASAYVSSSPHSLLMSQGGLPGAFLALVGTVTYMNWSLRLLRVSSVAKERLCVVIMLDES